MEGGRPQRELRILAFADLHLDHALPWATRETGEATRVAQQVAFDAICAIAAAEADVLISAGDLYDFDRHHPETGELLRAGFERLAPMPVLLVPGVSDPLTGPSLYDHVKWSPNVKVLSSPTEPATPVPGLTVWAASGADDLAAITPDAAAFNLGVLHGPAPERPATLQHVIAAAGHQPADGADVTCPGAAYPVDPEDPPGGLVMLNVLEDGSVDITRRDIGTYAPPRPARRFPTDELADYDLAAIGEEQTVRGEFVRNLITPEESPVHLRRLALLSGLRALAGTPPTKP
jgi:calcineurin-like phosphoesterase family protein